MATEDTVDTTRDARPAARVSATRKCLPQQAAAGSGRTQSGFAVVGAREAARRAIDERESFRRSRKEPLAFAQALPNLPDPSARLNRVDAALRQRNGQRIGA